MGSSTAVVFSRQYRAWCSAVIVIAFIIIIGASSSSITTAISGMTGTITPSGITTRPAGTRSSGRRPDPACRLLDGRTRTSPHPAPGRLPVHPVTCSDSHRCGLKHRTVTHGGQRPRLVLRVCRRAVPGRPWYTVVVRSARMTGDRRILRRTAAAHPAGHVRRRHWADGTAARRFPGVPPVGVHTVAVVPEKAARAVVAVPMAVVVVAAVGK